MLARIRRHGRQVFFRIPDLLCDLGEIANEDVETASALSGRREISSLYRHSQRE